MMLLMLLPLEFMGCGGSESSGNQIRRRRSNAKPAAKRVITEKTDLDMSKVPARFREIDWSKSDIISSLIRGSRDPFLPHVEDLLVKTEDTADEETTEITSTINNAEVAELKLVALITGTAVHKAMVEDGRGVGHIIQASDVVGRKLPMRVVRITRNEIIFKALQKPEDDKTPSEIRKVLRSQEELQELLP
ncbi:MAG: hypothetical protein VYA30_07620 [Myxococcota bacterium]|nr:hypothetical protein [Myxococcota bacterium]